MNKVILAAMANDGKLMAVNPIAAAMSLATRSDKIGNNGDRQHVGFG